MFSASDTPVNQWSLTLHGSGGIVSQFDSQEAQFVLGTEEASDVLRVVGDGIAPDSMAELADLCLSTVEKANETVALLQDVRK